MAARRGVAASLMLVAVSVVLALLLGEVLLRALGQSYYWAIAKRPDPILGWRPPPNVSAWQRFEGTALVQTNSLGFRDRDHALGKADGLFRVAVLGDSFTEAVQVPLQQTWWRQLEVGLNDDACLSVVQAAEAEVLNFAVSGYSNAQALLSLRRYGLKFQPDVVILALFIGNDLVENSPQLDTEPMRPYFSPAAEGTGLRLDRGFLEQDAYRQATARMARAKQWLLEGSRLLQLLVQVRDARRLGGVGAGEPPAADGWREPGVDSNVFRAPNSDAWHDAWERTERILAAFEREVRQAGAQPMLMLIGTGAQVHPDARVVQGFARILGVPDLGYPVRRLLDVANALHLPVLNLPALMAARAELDGQALHGFPGAVPGFGHWNPGGHRIAAETALQMLCGPVGGQGTAGSAGGSTAETRLGWSFSTGGETRSPHPSARSR